MTELETRRDLAPTFLSVPGGKTGAPPIPVTVKPVRATLPSISMTEPPAWAGRAPNAFLSVNGGGGAAENFSLKKNGITRALRVP